MRKKAALFAVFLALFIVSLVIVGCDAGGGTSEPPVEDKGPWDASKVAVSGLTEEQTAELGTRYIIPVPSVTYSGYPKEVTFAVKDSEGQDVELIAQGTRIFVDDVDGYTVEYFIEHLEEQHSIGDASITVLDTAGPEIELPASAYSMTVEIGSDVAIPVATITDGSGVVASSSVTVTYDGKEVDIVKGQDGAPDTFAATQYGYYTITYTATDGSGNTSTVPVTVNCARMVTLCDFETDSVVWGEGGSFTTEHAYSGNALKMVTEGNAKYYAVAVYPTFYNLSGFDSLSINIWVSRDLTSGNEGFYLLNQVFRLQAGDNIVTIDKEALYSQYPDGIVPSKNPQYATAEYLWFQVCGDGVEFYIDNLVGVYDDFETDTAAPTIDFGRANAAGIINVNEGALLTVPQAYGYDNTMEDVTIDYTVATDKGTDITEAVKGRTYRAVVGETYTVTYTATDITGLTSTRDFTINVRAQEPIDLPDGDDLPTDRKYDMLQDFETGLNSSVAVSPEAMVPDAEAALTTQYARSGKAFMVGPTSANYAAVKVKLLKDGAVLTSDDFAAYDYLQISVVCDTDGTQFWFYEQRYDLVRGLNVLRFTKDVIQAQINEASYNAEGWLWFQTCPAAAGAEYTIWLDQMIGVYPEEGGEEDGNFDLLNGFETGQDSSIWVQGGVTNTATNAVDGMAVRFTTSTNWQAISVSMRKDGAVMTREDFAAYDHFELYVYAEKAGATLYFYNLEVATLQQGVNTVTISVEDFLAQYDAGLGKSPASYSDSGFAFWQIGNGADGYTLYFDNLIGVYPEQTPAA